MSPAIRIGSVHIVESLPTGELRTGERIRDVVEPLGLSTSPQISVQFWREPTRSGLFRCFERITEDVRAFSRPPIIQIETHGNPQGLGLASGEFVPWADLKAPLTQINLLCRLNLIVLLGACDGAELLRIIQPVDRAPVWGLIGPSRIISAGESEDAHTAFYRTLFETRDGGPAWLAMNAAIKAGDRPFRLFRAERMFKEVMTAYYRRSTETVIAAQLARVVSQAVTRGMSGAALQEFERHASAYIRDHKGRFDEFKSHFFFSDLCPEHWDRFKVSFEQCVGEDAATPP